MIGRIDTGRFVLDSPFRTERLIGTCKCGRATRVDGALSRCREPANHRGRVYSVFTDGSMSVVRYSGKTSVVARCPECGLDRLVLHPIRVVPSPETKCDARCEGAKGPRCECSCMAENHGRSFHL